MIFDTHAHYDESCFDPDREALLGLLPDCGIGAVVNVGSGLPSSVAGRGLAARFPHVFFSAGVHPDDTGEAEETGEEAALARLAGLLEDPKAVAVGEIGLDYHGDFPGKPSRQLQEKWFRLQLWLAAEKRLPVIIHSREAAEETYRILREEGSGLTADMHCFSFEKEMAKRFLDLGCYLGIGGVVTYKNGRKLKEVVQYMPADRILLETDCPFLAPEPYRGRRNSSLFLPEVVAAIAALRGVSEEEVRTVTWNNARRFYRLEEVLPEGRRL